MIVSGVSGEGVTEILRAAFAKVRAARGEADGDEDGENGGAWAP